VTASSCERSAGGVLDVCLVSHASYPYAPGGVTRWADALVRGLPGLRFGVVHAGPRRARPLPMPGNVAGAWDLRGGLPPARVYHALSPAAADLAAGRAARAGRPLLLTCHALQDGWVAGEWRGVIPQDGSNPHPPKPPKIKDYAGADVIAAVSRAVAASHVAAGAPAERTVVIPNGAPEAARRPAPAEPLVGFVGRLAPVKGLERLVRAFRLVRGAHPEARLALVGPDDGPPGYVDDLRAEIRRLGLSGAVDLPGASRPGPWYRRMTCLALASGAEGMPLALLEAMAHGVPCVVPDVGGCREAVGEAGIVVPAGDVEALAAGIARLIQDSAESARLGAFAAARASRWTEADAAAAYERLYRTLGASPGGR